MSPAKQHRTIRVWIIEDSRDYREELRELIALSADIECDRVFGSFEEVLPAIRMGTLPDVVLVDIRLPGASGIEAIRTLKGIAPELHLMVLTISEDREVIVDAIRAGIDGYLLKNDPIENILHGIRLVADGGSPLSGAVAGLVMEALKKVQPTGEGEGLSERETEILRLLADGFVKKEVAQELHIAPVTVDYHLRSIYRKLQVHSQAGAVGKAIRRGVI